MAARDPVPLCEESDLANKNKGCSIQFEFHINNK